jgi:hypothetical protein
MASDPDPSRPPQRPLPYYAPAPSNDSGLGVLSLVLGIIGLICSIIPVVGLISWLIAPGAIITGVLGLKSPASRGLAIGGLATGGLALIVCLIWAMVFGALISTVGSARNF